MPTEDNQPEDNQPDANQPIDITLPECTPRCSPDFFDMKCPVHGVQGMASIIHSSSLQSSPFLSRSLTPPGASEPYTHRELNSDYNLSLSSGAPSRIYETMMQNERGEWVPAIPMPEHTRWGRFACRCGTKRPTLLSYQEHYAYEHIVMGRE